MPIKLIVHFCTRIESDSIYYGEMSIDNMYFGIAYYLKISTNILVATANFYSFSAEKYFAVDTLKKI